MSPVGHDEAVGDVTLDEICVVALAEAFRGDGEILCLSLIHI